MLRAFSITATSSYHPTGNVGVESVHHTTANMLAIDISERQASWDAQLPHVELSCNNSLSAAARLAPNEGHMGRLQRLSFSRFSNAPVSPDDKFFPAISSRIETSRRAVSRRRTTWFESGMLSQYPALTAETQPYPTCCGRFLASPSAAGRG